MGDEKTSAVAKMELAGSSLRTSIEDGRIGTREMFAGLRAEERNALAADVWDAGLRAVANEAKEPRKPIRLSTIPPSSW
jgi:hypothetical protein